MDKRMIDFVRVLRAAGVRISLAESLDAMHGIERVGVESRDVFRSALKSTLIKTAADQKTFDYFFPLFFGQQTPPLENIPDNLSQQNQDQLQQALQSLMGDSDALQELLRQLLEGQPFDQSQLDQASKRSGLSGASDVSQRDWYQSSVYRQLQLQNVERLIQQLMEALEAMGMSAEALQKIREMLEQNAQGLSAQVDQFVGATLAERLANREPDPKPDLLDIPFTRLEDKEIDNIREEVRRLAARLRSRASLRQRRANSGTLDVRKMMRSNMRYDGVPLELRYKMRHVKPSLVLICDVSTSMRYCAEFLLTLIYELQDQVARTHSFIFINDLTDISMAFQEHDPRHAVEKVLRENRPGYYNTDLGHSMDTFKRVHWGCVTNKTTVVILGDGRNNYNNPRIDIMQELMRRGRRLLWFNPESRSQWGSGDSDMLKYAPASHGVYKVSTLRELANAVDHILVDR